MHSPMVKKPCSTCPFRKDVRMHLAPGRTDEIVDQLLAGETFSCHNTVDYGEGRGRRPDLRNRRQCAGATLMLLSMDRPNAFMQIAERLGVWDGEIDRSVATCLTREEFREQATEERRP